MSARPFLFVLIFIASMMSPLVDSFIGNAMAEDTVVCCDSVGVELHLLGSASSGTMSPFSQDLTETPTIATIASAITSEETVGEWVLPKVWPGTVPANTWKVSIQYEVSSASGAQVNATATLKIGSQTFSSATEPGSSFLGEGTGTLTFDIDIETTSISDNGAIELTLTARSVAFLLPRADAKVDFLWGSEESDSTIEAEIPLFDLTLLEPEVEGSEVYFSVVLNSNWGMDMYSNTALEMLVEGSVVGGDPIETTLGDGVRVTWTWEGAKGGIQTVDVEIRLTISDDATSISGNAIFEIETFDSSGGTGTYYPPDEPLKTNGDGSPLSVTGSFSLESSNGEVKIERETRIEIGGEMAFWMRWGMDHLGDEVTMLSPVLKSFDAGSVGDEERVSRSLEEVEVSEFERQMLSVNGSSLSTYYLSVGLGLDVKDLLGFQTKEFDTLSISVDLNGERNVVNHPITLVIISTKNVESGKRIPLLSNFITAQPSPLWSSYTLSLSGSTTAMTSFAGATVKSSEYVSLSHSRLPWGESLQVEGENLEQDEEFRVMVTPTDSPTHSPLPLLLLVIFGLGIGFMLALRFARKRQRKVLYFELILIPVVALMHFLVYPPLFVGGAVGTAVLIWWVTAITSPRSRTKIVEEAITLTIPVIPCPACSTPNPVVSQERPLRFACVGCERAIRIEA